MRASTTRSENLFKRRVRTPRDVCSRLSQALRRFTAHGGWQHTAVRKVNVLTPDPGRPSERERRVGEAVGAEQMGATVYVLAAGESSSAYHFHHGVEEWLVVLDGEPVVRTADGERSLRKGDVLCFPAGAAGVHEIKGPGTVMLVDERRALDVVEYPDDGTIELRPAGTRFRTADAIGLGESS
jgi:uncharacterized cupin superfamily protein